MVDSEVLRLDAAVLTCVVVTCKDRVARRPQLRHGAPHCVTHFENRRCRVTSPNGRHRQVPMLQHFRLTQEQEGDRSPHIADVERLVITIKNKYLVNGRAGHRGQQKRARMHTHTGPFGITTRHAYHGVPPCRRVIHMAGLWVPLAQHARSFQDARKSHKEAPNPQFIVRQIRRIRES